MHRHLVSILKRRPLQLQCLSIPSNAQKTQRNRNLRRQQISTTRPHASDQNPFDALSASRTDAKRRAYYQRRLAISAAGLIASIVATALLVALYPIPPSPMQSEAPPDAPRFSTESASIVIEKRESIISTDPESSDASTEDVPTGTSSVPSFPKTIYLPTSSPSSSSSSSSSNSTSITSSTEPYQLIGLGIRTVSFLSIQVYIVGLYIATADVPALQAALAHHTAGLSATALLPNERASLRTQLLDGTHSADAWTDVLAAGGEGDGWRSALRVVPTRTTDFAHLRDGWVRGLVAAAGPTGWSEDAAFGEAVGVFKALFGGRKGVRKGRAVVLGRDRGGRLEVWFDGQEGGEGKSSGEIIEGRKGGKESTEGSGWSKLGEVKDERISRGIWLAYLGGKKVASEEARRSIVDGMIRLGERPVGTVETVV